AQGGMRQFTATGNFSDGTSHALTSLVDWSSSNGSVLDFVTPGTPGLATAGAAGSATITAEYTALAVTGNTTATVTSASVSDLQVSPVITSGSAGTSLQLTATAIYSDNSTDDVSSTAIWSSSDTDIATVNASGTVSLLMAGSVTITAS